MVIVVHEKICVRWAEHYSGFKKSLEKLNNGIGPVFSKYMYHETNCVVCYTYLTHYEILQKVLCMFYEESIGKT